MKAITYSLWGNNPKYTYGAIENAKQIPEIFGKEWYGRFYCGSSTPEVIIKTLQELPQIKVIRMPEEGDWTGMFWRFISASDPQIDVMISRDTDSRLSLREKECVDEWLESGKSFHIIRDHPLHNTTILGGLWGVRGDKLRNMSYLIHGFKKGNYHQTDQIFLNELVYPIIKDDCFVHDEFFTYNKDAVKIKMKRDGLSYLGQAYDENNAPDTQYDEILRSKLKIAFHKKFIQKMLRLLKFVF